MEVYTVVLQTAFLGDLLLTYPLVKNIKKIRPNHKTILVLKKGYGSFIKGLKWCDEVYEIDKSNSSSYQEVLNLLKNKNVENLISCSFSSYRMLRLSWKIKATNKIGYNWSLASRFVNTHHVQRNKDLPEALRLIQLLENLDPELSKSIDDFLTKNQSQIPVAYIPKVLSGDMGVYNGQVSRRVAVFPGSVWNTKKWTQDGFIDLCANLKNMNLEVILLGGKEEADIGEYISKNVSGVDNQIGKLNITESFEIIKKSLLVISNDSGGQHLASLAGAPVVTIYGPTVPAFGYYPWNTRSAIVENLEVKCRPCSSHGPQVCPIGTHECMKSISAEQVIKAIQLVSTL